MRSDYGFFEEDHLGKLNDAGLWRRIVLFTAPYWKGVALAILLAAIVIGAGLLLPHLFRQGIDNYIINTSLAGDVRLAGLLRLALVFMAVVAVEFVANFLQVYVLEWTGQNVMHTMRQHLFSHLLGLDLAFFNRNPAGKLVTRLTNDIQNMHEMFTSVIVTVFNDSLKLLGIMGILFWMNWRLALLMVLLLPFMLGNTLWFSRLARDAFRSIRTQLARINSFLQEALSGVSILQLFRREADTLARFTGLNQDYLGETLYQIKIFGIFMPAIEFFSSMAIAGIIWYGGSQVLDGRMTIGVLVAFIYYMRLFFQPLRELSQKYSIVQSALASAERIFQLLDTRPGMTRPGQPVVPEKIAGAIEFRNVDFSYDQQRPVIHNLSFTIMPGETVAVVGATGSGKTTIINLLERFYDPDRGLVLLDGNEVGKLSPEWLRRQIGLVMQDVFVIPGTMRENILLDQNLEGHRLEEIVRQAQLRRLVAQMPHGLETRIGEGGMEISAGQRQLLAFARVLARDPRILILDEATSNVDTESEVLIEKAIAEALANRTSIVIAHRLSTIRRADRILVLDKGVLVEQGSHEELLRRQGYYQRMVNLQNGAGTIGNGKGFFGPAGGTVSG